MLSLSALCDKLFKIVNMTIVELVLLCLVYFILVTKHVCHLYLLNLAQTLANAVVKVVIPTERYFLPIFF